MCIAHFTPRLSLVLNSRICWWPGVKRILTQEFNTHELQVLFRTGDVRGAATTSNVHLIMHGGGGVSSRKHVFLYQNHDFKR